MRYNKNGEALLHRLGQNASFSEVVLTVRHLGYELRCEGNIDFVRLDTNGQDKYGHTTFNSKPVPLDELIESLNTEMESRDLIKRKVEI